MELGRRGMIQDMIYFFSFMFMLAFFTLGMYIAWSETDAAFSNTEAITPEAQAVFSEQATRFPQWMDYTYLTIMIAVFIGILILSYFVSTVPVMFWAMWLFVMVLSAVAGYMANAWFETTQDGILSIAVQQFPIMNYVVSNYMAVVIILGMLMLIVFFAKPSGGGV